MAQRKTGYQVQSYPILSHCLMTYQRCEHYFFAMTGVCEQLCGLNTIIFAVCPAVSSRLWIQFATTKSTQHVNIGYTPVFKHG